MSAFRDMGLKPKEIIYLEPTSENPDELFTEASEFNYSQFFDMTLDVSTFAKENDIPVKYVNSKSVNDPDTISAVKNALSNHILFTGGGILKKDVLGVGKRFIHVHPGLVPKYRGSTCFYYSMLETNTCGATAFFMDENLDTGNVIAQQGYAVNYQMTDKQKYFMDYVLDPFIRSDTLKIVLQKMSDPDEFVTYAQEPAKLPAYYVMHPLLRHLAIEKMNLNFSIEKSMGIFRIDHELE